MEVIPEFYYTFKAFSTQNFTFSLKHDIFIIKKFFYSTHQVRCYHFFIVEIIIENVNLIQM